MLASISLLKKTTLPLFQKFQKEKDLILDSGEEKPVRQTRALQLFETRLKDFKKTWSSHHRPDPIQVKDYYVPFLHFFIADLALYWGVQANGQESLQT